jgi:hypothetical protein
MHRSYGDENIKSICLNWKLKSKIYNDFINKLLKKTSRQLPLPEQRHDRKVGDCLSKTWDCRNAKTD